MDDCILSSLSLPPGTKPDMNAASCSPALQDSTPPEHKALLQSGSINTSGLEKSSRRKSEAVRQRPGESRDSGSWQLKVRGGSTSQERKSLSTQPCDETIDLTTCNDNAEASEGNQNLKTERVLRKRKRSEDVDVPPKQPVDASAFL